jgi:hypothetical protein
MKSSKDNNFSFDWKSVYVVPLMTLTVSICLIFAVIFISANNNENKYSKNEHLVKSTKNLLAEAYKH